MPVIVEVDVAVQALRGMISEMMARYKLLEEAGSRNIESYNRDRAPHEKMPFIVVAVDELADLMMSASKDIETLHRQARSAGPRHGHPPGCCDTASISGRGDRPDKGQLPGSHRLRRGVAGGLPHYPGQRGGREPPGPRRHAVPALGRAQAHSRAGRIPIGPGNWRPGQPLAKAERAASAANLAGERGGCPGRAVIRTGSPATTCWTRRGTWPRSTTACRRRSCRGACASGTRGRPG